MISYKAKGRPPPLYNTLKILGTKAFSVGPEEKLGNKTQNYELESMWHLRSPCIKFSRRENTSHTFIGLASGRGPDQEKSEFTLHVTPG